MQAKKPALASKPELNSRPAGAWWKEAIVSSSASAYAELPSRRREPRLPRWKVGVWVRSSWRKWARRRGEVESERKSLDEKSMLLVGVMVSLRRAERVWRRERVRRRVVRRGVGGVGGVVDGGRGGAAGRVGGFWDMVG